MASEHEPKGLSAGLLSASTAADDGNTATEVSTAEGASAHASSLGLELPNGMTLELSACGGSVSADAEAKIVDEQLQSEWKGVLELATPLLISKIADEVAVISMVRAVPRTCCSDAYA